MLLTIRGIGLHNRFNPCGKQREHSFTHRILKTNRSIVFWSPPWLARFAEEGQPAITPILRHAR